MGKRRQPTSACPCGSGEPYAACCGPLHGGRVAATAEALMRSRYSAYALGLVDYLRGTWHPQTCPAELDLDPATRWLGLKILATEDLAPDQALVEFRARYRQGGTSAGRLHERSRFVLLAGRWVYQDGEILP